MLVPARGSAPLRGSAPPKCLTSPQFTGSVLTSQEWQNAPSWRLPTKTQNPLRSNPALSPFFRYYLGMPLRWCEVTRILPDGRRHTIKLEATSIYHAAVLYYGMTVSAPGEKLPPFDSDTVLEIQHIFLVRHEDALKWANREAERLNQKR